MSTQPKFSPGQRAKVTGNQDKNGKYHSFKIGETVEIVEYAAVYFAWECVGDDGHKQCVMESDLEPIQSLNHE